jgi:hypothetical protein
MCSPSVAVAGGESGGRFDSWLMLASQNLRSALGLAATPKRRTEVGGYTARCQFYIRFFL